MPIIRSLKAIRDNPFPKPKPLIQGLINQGELVIVTGLWDSFKSRFGAEMVRSVVTGERFLGHFNVLVRGGGLIWQQEINAGFYDERILDLCKDLPDTVPLLTCYDQFTFSKGYGEVLYDLIKEHNLKLIVFDPLTNFWPQEKWFDENASSPVALALSPLLRLRQTGCSFIIVHHDPKPSMGNSGVARGSSVLVNAPDARILLKRDDVRLTVTARTRNLRPPPRFQATIDADGRLEYAGDIKSGPNFSQDRMQAMKEFAAGKTAAEVVANLKLSKTSVYRWWDEYEQSK